jgi:hypothetical protein
VELVDTLDLKSNDHCGRAGSSPASSTDEKSQNFVLAFFVFKGLIRKHTFLRRLQNKKITKREALVAFLSK